MLTLSLLPLLIAGLAAATPAALERRAASFYAPEGPGPFALQVIATSGNVAAYSGEFLGPYHTGAGLNALVTTHDQSAAQLFNFNATDGTIYATLGAYPYYLTLPGSTAFAPPKNYQFAGFDVGGGSGGWSFQTPQNVLVFPNAFKGDTFSICPALIYSPGAYIDTLVYQTAGAAKNATCAQVKLKGIF